MNTASSVKKNLLLAVELERLEKEHWRVLLSDASAYTQIEAALSERLPAPDEQWAAVTQDARRALTSHGTMTQFTWAAAVESLTDYLQRQDVDRTLVRATHLTLAKLAADDPRFSDLAERAEAARKVMQQLKDKIVLQNLKLVESIARRYRFSRMSFADMVQEGSLGLIRAVERFDYRLGFGFATYASWWIRHAIRRGVVDKSRTIRIPAHMVETRSRLARTKQAFEIRAGSAPNVEALARATGISETKVELAEGLPSTQLSLDLPVDHDEGTCFKDLLVARTDEDPMERRAMEESLRWLPQWMDCLGPLELQITRWRFGLESERLTFREIGDKYGLSRERIRQLQEQALGKIRSQMLRHESEQDARMTLNAGNNRGCAE